MEESFGEGILAFSSRLRENEYGGGESGEVERDWMGERWEGEDESSTG